jgi:hypothetical protein
METAKNPLLIFLPKSSNIGELGRIRLKEINGRTWINGETVGNQDDPMTAKTTAYILKVWPEREHVQLLRPDESNPGLDRIQESHCP